MLGINLNSVPLANWMANILITPPPEGGEKYHYFVAVFSERMPDKRQDSVKYEFQIICE